MYLKVDGRALGYAISKRSSWIPWPMEYFQRYTKHIYSRLKLSKKVIFSGTMTSQKDQDGVLDTLRLCHHWYKELELFVWNTEAVLIASSTGHMWNINVGFIKAKCVQWILVITDSYNYMYLLERISPTWCSHWYHLRWLICIHLIIHLAECKEKRDIFQYYPPISLLLTRFCGQCLILPYKLMCLSSSFISIVFLFLLSALSFSLWKKISMKGMFVLNNCIHKHISNIFS